MMCRGCVARSWTRPSADGRNPLPVVGACQSVPAQRRWDDADRARQGDGCRQVTLGGLIDRLETTGLLKRLADPSDRRAKRVVMTPRGTKLLADIQGIAAQVNAQIMNGISRSDISRTETVLYKMKQQLISMDAVPGAATPVPARRTRTTADQSRPARWGASKQERHLALRDESIEVEHRTFQIDEKAGPSSVTADSGANPCRWR